MWFYHCITRYEDAIQYERGILDTNHSCNTTNTTTTAPSTLDKLKAPAKSKVNNKSKVLVNLPLKGKDRMRGEGANEPGQSVCTNE